MSFFATNPLDEKSHIERRERCLNVVEEFRGVKSCAKVFDDDHRLHPKAGMARSSDGMRTFRADEGEIEPSLCELHRPGSSRNMCELIEEEEEEEQEEEEEEEEEECTFGKMLGEKRPSQTDNVKDKGRRDERNSTHHCLPCPELAPVMTT